VDCGNDNSLLGSKKLRDNEIIAVANQYTIEQQFDLSSTNLIQNAIDQGWYNTKDQVFNFKEVYGDPNFLNEIYDTDREDRVMELLNKKRGKHYISRSDNRLERPL